MNNENEKIEGGATVWARKTIDSEIFFDKPDKWFKIWFYLINRVNHKDVGKWNKGECFLIYDEITQHTKATIDQIKKCMCWLRENSMVSTTRSTRGVKIKILNYKAYQNLNNYYLSKESTIVGTNKALEKHSDKQECKNEKNNTEKKQPPKISKQLVDELIILTGLSKPDGDYHYNNLYPAKNLAKLIEKEIQTPKNPQPSDNNILKAFIKLYEKMDDFHQKNATSIKYIYDNWGKINNNLK